MANLWPRILTLTFLIMFISSYIFFGLGSPLDFFMMRFPLPPVDPPPPPAPLPLLEPPPRCLLLLPLLLDSFSFLRPPFPVVVVRGLLLKLELVDTVSWFMAAIVGWLDVSKGAADICVSWRISFDTIRIFSKFISESMYVELPRSMNVKSCVSAHEINDYVSCPVNLLKIALKFIHVPHTFLTTG